MKPAMTARDIMKTELLCVEPELSLPELERKFLEDHVGGFPVVAGGELLGLITHSDIVRQLCVEQSIAEVVSDYHQNALSAPVASLEDIAGQVGQRIENLRVKDFMVRDPITVSPEDSIESVAKLLVDRHIHRVLVTVKGKLVGILSTLDLVRLIATGKAKVVP